MRKRLADELTEGTVLGNLVCTGLYEYRPHRNPTKTQKREPWFECECTCGSGARFYPGYMLTAGRVKSCGCIHGDMIRAKFRAKKEAEGKVPEEGEKFGRLTVIRKGIFYREGRAKIYLQCACGANVWKSLSELLRGRYTSCGNRQCRLNPREDVCNFYVYGRYKRAAAIRSIGFYLSLEEFSNFIQQECHYCGVSPYNLHINKSRTIGDYAFNYNGIDRKDSSLAYTTDNVVPCCGICNSSKWDLSYADFLANCVAIAIKHKETVKQLQMEAAMSIGSRIRTITLAYANNLLDHATQGASVPVLKQYVRDLEDAIEKTNHETAVAHANVTVLQSQIDGTTKTINLDTQRAQAYLVKNDETNARLVATRIHDSQILLDSLKEQISQATSNSQQLDTAYNKMQAKHSEVMAQLRVLESKDRQATALHSATSSLKSASAILSSTDVADSVDSISRKIEQKAAVENEEFNRAVGAFDTPPDPLKDAAVDDILNNLRPKSAVAA